MADRPGGTQLAIDLPHDAALGRDDLIVHDGNAAAVALIDCWPDWPGRILALSGPAAVGKTHLAAIWAQRAGAWPVGSADLGIALVPDLGGQALLIEEADRIADETAFFHLINQVRESGGSLLLTARAAPARWRIGLPDLASRLAAMPVVNLGLPDEAVLSALMLKLLADRQLTIDVELADWAVSRMDRTPAAVKALVERLDHHSLARRVRLGPKLVRELVGESGEG